MSNINLDLAKKLKSLAERGIGGEKINAEKMLQSFLKKHGLTIEQIDEDKKSDYFFKIKKEQLDLWGQIVKCVNKDIKAYDVPKSKVKEFGLKSSTFITCTLAEYFLIESMFSFYWPIYEAEQKVFRRAFCTANNLLVQSNLTSDDLTVEEIKEVMRANKMANSIRQEAFRKQLKQS